MAIRLLARVFDSVDISSAPVAQLFKVSGDVRVLAIRTTIIKHNVSFTDITAQIRSVSNGDINEVLANSTTTHKSGDLFSESYGFSDMYFKFDNFALEADTVYAFNLKATGYTRSGDNHLAWVKDHPNAVHTALDYDQLIVGTDSEITLTKVKGGIAPYKFQLITAEF